MIQQQMPPYTAQEIIDLTNQYRQANKLPLLKVNATLMKAAQERVNDLAKTANWSHQTTGLNYYQLMDKSGYKRQYAGENLAKGFNTATAAMDALKKSPTHNANLIKSNYQDTGVAISKGADGKYYAVQFFGNQLSTTNPTITPTSKPPLLVNPPGALFDRNTGKKIIK